MDRNRSIKEPERSQKAFLYKVKVLASNYKSKGTENGSWEVE
jgi:hypothetical protein